MPDTQLIFYKKDDFGEIKVHEDGKYRLLSFGNGDEQSRINIATPHILQHEYSQAMMLSLLFLTPKRLTVLGVGGGCLLSSMHAAVPGIHITGVELRASVIEVAQSYFHLPSSKRVQIIEKNAVNYIADSSHKKSDLLFTDLYNAYGMSKAVLEESFLLNCDQQLKESGWLVINCWEDEYHYHDLIEQLRIYFLDIRSVNTGAGNWVIFAGKTQDNQNAKQLKQKAQRISQVLGFPLTKWLNRLTIL